MGRDKRKNAFDRAQNVQIQLIRGDFALYSYIAVQYPMSLLADSEGSDQTARMPSLSAYTQNTFSHGAAHIFYSCSAIFDKGDNFCDFPLLSSTPTLSEIFGLLLE